MWTDTTTVLQWLPSGFSANRVTELLHLTTTDEWNYVQTSVNPAHAGSRGISAHVLSASLWLKCPDFPGTDDWPLQPSKDFLNKIKGNKFNSDQIPSERENKRHRQLQHTSVTSHQFPIGRRVAHTRNFCALLLTCCFYCPFLLLTGPSLGRILIQQN